MKKAPRKHKKIGKIIKRMLILFLFFCLGGITYSFGVATFENIAVNHLINDFKDRSTFEYEETIIYGLSEQTRRYYTVERTEDYELADTRSAFEDTNRMHLGKDGDVFLTQESPFPYIPVFHQFMSYYFGGHAALKSEELGFLQATGFPRSDQSLLEIMFIRGDEPHDYANISAHIATQDAWMNPNYRAESNDAYPYYGQYYRKKFIGVRVKNVDEEIINDTIDYANDQVGKGIYNFLFFLNMQYKYYCTDYISRSYQAAMLPEDEQGLYANVLNDDWFITSVNDIVLSDDTYLLFYVEIIDDVYHIYYLEDV